MNVCDSVLVSNMWIVIHTGSVGGNILRFTFTTIYFQKACVISEYL